MHPPTGAPAVVTRDLVKTYPVRKGTPPVRALDGLTLEVGQGEVFALLGPNGAGKSTTVRILSTLSRADSGTATVAGHDVQRDPGTVRRAIGLVSQKPSSAPMMTGRESLVLTGRIHGLSHAAARSRADELLHRFALTDAADRLTKTYSGGMSRKLDVAIGLVNRPSVLFLDEPTTGLDPEARAQMWAEVSRLARLEHTTVLLTTHYLDEADQLADRLAIIDRGRVVAEGSPDDLKAELHGDRVVLEIQDPASGALAVERLTSIPSMTEIVQDGRSVRARTGEGASIVPVALRALEDAGIPVSSATLARPSLDDVYLRHAGRTYAEAAS
jgi:ABC-2 type transport system ATP-binding protein